MCRRQILANARDPADCVPAASDSARHAPCKPDRRPSPPLCRRLSPPSHHRCGVKSGRRHPRAAGPKGNIASQVKRRRALSRSPVKPATRPYEQPQTGQASARLGDSCRRLRLRLPWGAPVSVWPGGILFVTAGKGKKGAEKLVDLLMHELAHQ